MLLKKRMALALICVLCLVYACALGATTTERVFDGAGLFTASEKASIAQSIAQFQQDTGMDFVVLTSKEAHGDVSVEQIADDFYDKYAFGLDEENSGILYYVDMYERLPHISTTGAMIDYITDSRLESIFNASSPYLTSGDYGTAVNQVLSKVRGYIRAGIPEGQYQYDIITGQQLTARHKALTSNEVLVSALIAGILGLIFVSVVKRRYQLKGSTYTYGYTENCDMRITDTDDTYLRSATRQTRKPQHDDTRGGGGGFGGGGGSGVHTGSSGTSHGGGTGGRF